MSTNPAMDRHVRREHTRAVLINAGKVILVALWLWIGFICVDALGGWPRGG